MKAKQVLSRILGGRAHTFAIMAMVGFTGLILGLQRAPGGPNNIVIKDSKGQKRIEMGVFGDEPGLIMYDKNGQPRVRLEMLEERDVSQTYLRFMGPTDEQYTAEFGGCYTGGKRSALSSWMHLVGPHGSALALDAGPIPHIEVMGEKPEHGPAQASMSLNVAAGAPKIAMDDTQGNRRLSIQVTEQGSPEIQCRDEEAKVIWQAPPKAEKSSSDKPKKEKQEENQRE